MALGPGVLAVVGCVWAMGGAVRADVFRAGERLTFEARWGIVLAAELTLEAVERGSQGDGDFWRFVGTAHSRGPVEMFYRVRSRVESTARPSEFEAWRYFEDRHEGGHRYHRLTTLDFASGTGRWLNYAEGGNKKLKLSGPACDLLSVCYRVRSLPWRVGDRRALRVFADGAYHTVHLRAEWRGSRRVGPWAEQPVVKIVCDDVLEPAKSTTGRLEAWITDDARHLPLLGRLKVSWGTVEIALMEADGIVGPPLRRASEKARREG